MKRAGKTYTTFNRVRLSLFIRSYACYTITYYLWRKYKIKTTAKPKELHEKYSRHALPEISRLAKVLNVNYANLWDAIILDKKRRISKKVADDEQIRAYFSIEEELISLVKAKQRKSDYTDPDYEDEWGVLTTAIERAIGDALCDVDDDYLFEQQSAELKRKYVHSYYKVACRYKLPTMRIVPFVMRLIK